MSELLTAPLTPDAEDGVSSMDVLEQQFGQDFPTSRLAALQDLKFIPNDLPYAPRRWTRRKEYVPRRFGKTYVAPEDQKLTGRVKNSLLIGGLATSIVLGAYIQDVQRNQAAADLDYPSISHALDAGPTAPADSMVVDFSGLSGNNAYFDAQSEVAYKALGDVEAVRYGNTLDAEVVGKAVIEHAKLLGKNSLVLSGRSMGGLVAVNVARYILENSDLSIPYIILDSSPSSLDSVRPERRTTAETLLNIFSYIPGAEDSTWVNFAVQYGGEVGSLYKFITMSTSQNLAIISKVTDEMTDGKKASLTLMFDEYNAIVAADMQASLKALGELPPERRPILALMQPEKLEDDHTILSDVSATEYRLFADEAGTQLLVIRVPGIHHANPGERPSEWNKGVTNQVIPALYLQSEQVLEEVIQQWDYHEPLLPNGDEDSSEEPLEQLANQPATTAPVSTPAG